MLTRYTCGSVTFSFLLPQFSSGTADDPGFKQEEDVWECLREYGLNPDPSGNIRGAALLLGKLRVLGGIGFTKSQCYDAAVKEKKHFKNVSAETIKENSHILFELHASIPTKTEADAIEYMVTHPRVLLYGKISVGVSIMKAAGMINDTILLFVKRKTRATITPALQGSVEKVKALGVINPRGSIFCRLLEGFALGKDRTIELRQLAYEEWGWDKTTFYRAAEVNPGLLSQAVETIHRKMQFFQDCGIDSISLTFARYPTLLSQKSFEECLKPRWYVYQYLINNRLIGTKPTLLCVFMKTESVFEDWVLAHGGDKGQMLVDAYTTWKKFKKAEAARTRLEEIKKKGLEEIKKKGRK